MGLIDRAAYLADDRLWRLRYWWLDTPSGAQARVIAFALGVLVLIVQLIRVGLAALVPLPPAEPIKSVYWWVVQLVIALVAAVIVYAMRPKTESPKPAAADAPITEDGQAVKDYFGTCWVEDEFVLAWKVVGQDAIRVRAGKSLLLKTKWQTTGYHFRVAYHHGIGRGSFDAFLEYRCGDQTAWSGALTASGTISVNAPNLFGGEKEQGGVVGDLDVMFGEADQVPNPYLIATFGPQVPAWRGVTTVVFKGGRYGAMSPYPQKASYKIQKIRQGWDGDGCWYSAKALIPMGMEEIAGSEIPELADTSGGWRYLQVANDGPEDYSSPEFDDSAWAVGAMPFASLDNHIYTEPSGFPAVRGSNWAVNTSLWLRKKITLAGASHIQMQILIDNFVTIWVNGHMVLGPESGHTGAPNLELNFFDFVIPGEYLVPGENTFVIKAKDVGLWTYVATRATAMTTYRIAGMNPAHALYYMRTDGEYGREPRENINEASLTAAADKLYTEGFGICTPYDPSQESPLEFENRICQLIGGSFNRSLVDGQWYLSLARGDYDIESLPVLTDHDVLDFKELPSTLDGAVNSLAVKYFDPDRKEDVVTPAVRALGLIRRFGEHHQVLECPEIPTGPLALRKAEMELRSRVTPTRAFDLVTKRRPYNWPPGTYFRLQLQKRGIADMVCIVGETGGGTLRSGALKLKSTQDIYSLPSTSYVEVEQGVDTRPSQNPVAISIQHAFEASYFDLTQLLTRADLDYLPAATGYLMTAALEPAASRDYTLIVDEGAGYVETGAGDWAASALVVEAAGFDGEDFTLAGGVRLSEVEVGMPALWGTELVRVDSLDVVTGAVSLGRGCGDTVSVKHAAGERIWFYGVGAAADQSEYSDGATLAVKLLTNTGNQQLAQDAATPLSVTFDSRAARPYPPGQFRINGQVEIATTIGEVTLTGVPRDRIQQADQLIDAETAGIGPEPGTTWTARYYVNGVLEHTDAGLATPVSSHTPSGAGLVRVEFESVRDGLTSYQMHVREFTMGAPLQDESGALITTENDEPILME